MKFSLLDDHLQGSVDWYLQNRTRLQQGGGVTSVVGTRAEGAELELRYVASANVSVTLAASQQHTTIKGPDHSFAYLAGAQLRYRATGRFRRQLYGVRFLHPAGAWRQL